MRVNDFNSSNGKDHHWEITNTFRYRINEHWLPYFELRWLDRNVETVPPRAKPDPYRDEVFLLM